MKHLLILASALISTLSYGSYTVCSGPSLYYSSVQSDFGTRPPLGTETGSLTIFGQGKLLEDETYVAGGTSSSNSGYAVTFVGPEKVLSNRGTEEAGSTIYTDIAILRSVAPLAEVELERTNVVCERMWAFVP